MSRPDVPADRLRDFARRGRAAQEAVDLVVARASHVRVVPAWKPGERGTPMGCQLCAGEQTKLEPLVIADAIVDRNNGQRITIAFCFACAHYLAKATDHTIPPQRRTTTRRKRK